MKIGKQRNKTANGIQQRVKGKSLKRRIILTVSFLLVIALIAFVLYGFYLDKIIRSKIDNEGSVWKLPVAIYGQIVNLEPHSKYSEKELIKVLRGAEYRQVKQVTQPGEYVVNKNSIELIRRPFDFPDGDESAYHVEIDFSGNQISEIKNLDNGRDFAYFRIDPKLITMLQSTNDQQRLYVPLKNIPHSLVRILVATEDRHFFEHGGISFVGIARAFVANLIAGHTVEGGSTLTQQLVKNLFLTNKRTLSRKLQEAYMALILNHLYSKDRVLELYFNEVYLGQSGNDAINGFALASLYYFGCPMNELTLDQQALLVGMVKGPSYYNPWRYPKRAQDRRDVVLSVMEEQGIITKQQYYQLLQKPLGVLDHPGVLSPQPAFMEIVKDQLKKIIASKAITDLSGMKVFTTFDPVLQYAADKAVETEIPILEKEHKLKNLQTAMVVVDRVTGEIKAAVGGANPSYPGYNRALMMRRQVGSMIKPSTYVTALSMPKKYRLNTILNNEPISINIPGQEKPWKPRNFEGYYSPQVTVLQALSESLNVPSVILGMQVGLDATAKTLELVGVPSKYIKPYPSRFLGAIGLTPLEAAQYIQTIANEGVRSNLSSIRFVMDGKGKVVYQSYPQSKQILSKQASYLTLFAMQQVIKTGTGAPLGREFKSYHLAGKTGTTNDYVDSWFAGVDGKNVVITWVGKDDHTGTGLTGSSGAMKVYRDFLEQETPTPLILKIPKNIIPMKIDKEGNFICNSKQPAVETIPVWTKDPKQLCEQSWLSKLFD